MFATTFSTAEIDLIVTAFVVLMVVFGVPLMVSLLRNRATDGEARGQQTTDTPIP